jgi:hypothetical protein
MLLDHFLPHCDVFERHATTVRATPERVYAALRTTDFAANPIVKLLLGLRGMGRRQPRTLDLETFRHEGFSVLADQPPRELVIGLEGPFWKPTCKLLKVDAESFMKPVSPNAARGAWNFFIEPLGDGTVRLSTETRVLCADDARLKFRLYWTFIRPFSGLIRIFMLRAIRKEAESA